MQTPEQNIDIESTTGVECEKCSSIYFEQAVHLRKASGLLTGQSKPSYIPVPIFKCTECNHVNKEFLPDIIGKK